MKKLLFVIACLVGTSCGKTGAPEIATPAEGQVFQIDNPQQPFQLQVTLVNNEFENVSIEFRGIEGDLAREIRCDNTTNSPYAQCYRVGQQGFGGGGFGTSCSAQSPCTVFIIATRDGLSSFRSVKFQRGGAQQPQQQPPR